MYLGLGLRLGLGLVIAVRWWGAGEWSGEGAQQPPPSKKYFKKLLYSSTASRQPVVEPALFYCRDGAPVYIDSRPRGLADRNLISNGWRMPSSTSTEPSGRTESTARDEQPVGGNSNR